MKMSCSKQELLEIVNTVQKAVMAKSTMPILECIKIDTSGDGNVVVTGNNLDMCIEYNTVMNVPEGGIVALASRMFGEIVRRLPEGTVTITSDPKNYVTKIECGASKFNIQGLDGMEYPGAPVLDEKYRFTLTQPALRRLIRKTISFVSVNEGRRPILTGALFEINDGKLNIVASDGHRLAIVTENVECEEKKGHFVVPGVTLRELLKLLKDEGDVTVIISDRHVMFDFGEFQVYTRMLEGEFLKYESIINVINSIEVVCDKSVIMHSLERAQLLISDDNAVHSENKVPVRFNIGYNKIDMSCITGKGQVNDTVDAEVKGGELVIGFNCRFLLDALSACDGDRVKIEFSAPTSGCFIRSGEDSDSKYLFMILPVRLYN
ncbi:MAG TPA: DNA polymerase III subunit beta [Candidatus Ornithomonoglobus intestinigallinarum]|uniref:Beta sliding clamp n=1 Tax=Candidatus Ornithomonoglobus intestinigallinarum TaxID=2840894 RepID=A0A9D1H1P6_9FIRM|nr:DNA polymerase III subunit beta [Candidatus Ornithomonoglobus intestinigallinarum]